MFLNMFNSSTWLLRYPRFFDGQKKWLTSSENCSRAFFGKKGRSILMDAFNAAGKTTVLFKLKLGEIATTIPTIGSSVYDHSFTSNSWSSFEPARHSVTVASTTEELGYVHKTSRLTLSVRASVTPSK
ncbi:hypothetical protein ANCCAN_14281 [Ancylostoma caninum]|uniref:Uncharacterized protein n=1 Tax=Ancylostoma caninum TaxID=29170 RepID=A0A368G7Z0_ANCCA|nr:hypothetical protein ANCCAN_14281 [Ancylostoma caninum]